MPGESSGGDDDVAGEPDTDTEGESPVDVWARGDRPNRNRKADAGVVPFDDLHFHRYCDLVPVRLTERERATGGSGRGSGRSPRDWRSSRRRQVSTRPTGPSTTCRVVTGTRTGRGSGGR